MALKKLAIFLPLILFLVSCGGETSGGAGEPSPETTPRADFAVLPEYPVIDGSSSTILMHMAIRAYLTDEHFSLEHSQTYAALERLIPGHADPADVVLAVKYYDETLEDAKKRGADLVITPVAKEGFIFILHKDNPIDSLTSQQLRDIYSGKVTNWSELGGKDEEIIPYTRNWDSGSQTAMEGFMDGTPIAGTTEEHIFDGMMMLLTGVEKAGSPGIGYNILSWSTRQNLDAMGLKAVAVDGVKPTNENLADSSYPLMVYTYSYYNKGNEKGEALTNWLLTDEGQKVVASADYVGYWGEMPPKEMPDLYKDEYKPHEIIEEYYIEQGLHHEAGWSGWFYPEHQKDKTRLEELAGGKGKDVTLWYLVNFSENTGSDDDGVFHFRDFTRFIVLTRERGGEFSVINEGEWES
jgi:ABC-type phosphate transport system substrate-binding protein